MAAYTVAVQEVALENRKGVAGDSERIFSILSFSFYKSLFNFSSPAPMSMMGRVRLSISIND
jgi:hypothetical protein